MATDNSERGELKRAIKHGEAFLEYHDLPVDKPYCLVCQAVAKSLKTWEARLKELEAKE